MSNIMSNKGSLKFLYYLFVIGLNGHIWNINGHILMRNPPPRRSAYSEYYVSQNLVNYDLNAPLNVHVGGSFFTFPCKGFPKGPSTQTVQGNKISVTLEGTATHGGGHCQFGISYDDINFLVLRTVMDNCLIGSMTYTFDVPSRTPSGEVTVFWTWVNAIGNREYYMECADINLQTSSKNRNVMLKGKELLVVNLPGYQTIPEFPRAGMYSGHDLFEARKDFSISPVGFLPLPTTETTIGFAYPFDHDHTHKQDTCNKSECSSSVPTITVTTTTVSICTNGNMRCKNNDFEMCDHNKWVPFSCAPGTQCKQNGNYILCDTV